MSIGARNGIIELRVAKGKSKWAESIDVVTKIYSGGLIDRSPARPVVGLQPASIGEVLTIS